MKARQTGLFLLVSGLAVFAMAAAPKPAEVAKKPAAAKPMTYKLQAAGPLFASDPLTCLASNASALKTELDAWKAIPNLEFSKGADGVLTGGCYYQYTTCIDACKASKAKIDAILQKCRFNSCAQLTVACVVIPG